MGCNCSCNLLFYFTKNKNYAILKLVLFRTNLKKILFVLWQKDKITQKELATEIGLAKNTITVMLEKMEKNNLIRRITDENDKRKSLVILTDYAKSLKKSFDEISDEMLKKVYKGFSEEEIDKYEEYLHRIIRNLEEKEVGDR